MYPPSSENYVSNVELNHFSFDWSFQGTELPPGVSQSDYAPPLPNAPPPCLPISTSYHHGQQNFYQQPKQQKTLRGKYNKNKREFGNCVPFISERSSSITHNHQFSRHPMSQYGYQPTHRITASQYDLQRSFNASSSQKPAAPSTSNIKNNQERIVKVDDTKKLIAKKPVNSDKKQPVLVFPRSKKPKTEDTKKYNQDKVICQANVNEEPLNPRTGVNAGLQLFKKKTNGKKLEFRLVSSIGLSKLNIDKCRTRESRVQDDHLDMSAKKIKLDTNKSVEVTQTVQSTKPQEDKEDNVNSNLVESLKSTTDETLDDAAHKNDPIIGNEKENEDAGVAFELTQTIFKGNDLNTMDIDVQLYERTESTIVDEKATENNSFDAHKEILELEKPFDNDNANHKVDSFNEKFEQLKKSPQDSKDSTDTEGLRSVDSIKQLSSKQKRVKKLLSVTNKEGKECKQPKSQSRPRQNYARKQEKISWVNVKDAKVTSCESCGDKSKDLETVGALELCSTCVPLFAPQMARAKAFPHDFKLNQKVEVLNIDKVWYPAKIVIVEKTQVKVNFDGWGREFDEWISVDSRRLKVQVTGDNSDDCLSRPIQKDNYDIQTASMDLQKNPKSENSESLSSCPDTDSESDTGSSSNSPESELTTLSDESDSEYNTVSNSSSVGSARLRRRTGYRKNVTLSQHSVSEPKSTQPKESLCESCKIVHLNVQRVGSLDLCSYCRTLFDDDNTIRFRRAGQYGFQPHKRVKILGRDNKWYPATQVDVTNGRIRVHFDGWSDKFDEWVPAGSQRMKDMTLDEILEAQKALEESTETFDENESMLILHNKGRIRVKGQNKSPAISSSSKKSSSQSKNVQSKKRDYQYDGDSDIRSQQSESNDSLASFDWNDFYIGRNTRRSMRNDKLLSNSNILAQLKARFKPGNQIEVRNRLREWVPATIVESKGCRVLIHYDDVPAFYDEWVDISSERLRMKPVKTNETCVIGQDNKDKQTLLKNKKDDRKKKSKLEAVDDSLEFIDLNTLPSDMTGNYLIKSLCYAHQFPSYHEHPRCSFACQSVIDDEAIKMSSKGEVIKTFDKDIFDTTYKDPGIDLKSENVQLDSGMGYLYLQAWNSRKICGFCNDDDDQQLGGFIGPQPFVTNTYTRHGEKQKIFWAHEACAKYSPEVFVSKSNDWYNYGVLTGNLNTYGFNEIDYINLNVFDASRNVENVKKECFAEKFPETHEHSKEDFEETCKYTKRICLALTQLTVKQIKDQQITKQTEMALANQKARESGKVRQNCFELVLVNNTTGESHLETNKLMVTSEDYSYRPYLTRNSCSDKKFDYSESQTIYLDTYEPAENQLFSLPFDMPCFVSPKRMIESCQISLEEVIALSQRNCSFAIPPDRGITAEHRPIILQADSRHLTGTIFENESFDHVLNSESDDDIPEYERIRQKQIQENQKMLLSLGLKCDLGEESDDISHLEKILNSKPLPPPTPTALIVIPHIPNTALNSQTIPYYRAIVKRLAREAYDRLPPSGFLVIGGQDVRTSDNKLWPLSMLFMEDVNKAVGEDKMPLKELVITVPDGYAKDKKKICSYEDYTEERCIVNEEENAVQLPIVHVSF
ncbi:2671_t:CDS:10 [Racocetra fulgida]|uniref:2671_t:CDS:1 n=1 Tax=Racocetra fulgida TaxID=60492 RepID=A0A9N8VDG4_9GLOM|nr:2671_t:CDS:10 [Racocetra fulgida]